MYRLKERPVLKANDFLLGPPNTFLAALEEKYDALGVGAAIFNVQDDGISRLLFIQRSETDSYPGRWELPGGGVDNTDASIRDALFREVKEETGLTVSWIIQQIGDGQTFRVRNGARVLKLTFVVEIHEIEVLADQRTEAPRAKSAGSASNGHDQIEGTEAAADGNVKLTATDTHQEAAVPVTLNPDEHQAYVWVTEEEFAARRIGDTTLKFMSDDQLRIMSASFEIQKAVVESKLDALGRP